MGTINEYMSMDHKHCDELFADAEQAVADGAWADGQAKFERFRQALERHMDMEENVLFPEFETRSGMTEGGPTMMMRAEHQQMRDLLGQMTAEMHGQDRDAYLNACETLLILMQQHNMKEEQMMYDMADQQFGDESPAIVQRMQDMA